MFSNVSVAAAHPWTWGAKFERKREREGRRKTGRKRECVCVFNKFYGKTSVHGSRSDLKQWLLNSLSAQLTHGSLTPNRTEWAILWSATQAYSTGLIPNSVWL